MVLNHVIIQVQKMSENWNMERFLENCDETRNSADIHSITKELNDLKNNVSQLLMKVHVLEVDVASCFDPTLLSNANEATASAQECSVKVLGSEQSEQQHILG